MELMNDVFYWYKHGVPPSNAANSPTVFCGIWHCPFFGGKEYKMLVPKKKKGAGTAGVSNTLSPWAFARVNLSELFPLTHTLLRCCHILHLPSLRGRLGESSLGSSHAVPKPKVIHVNLRSLDDACVS